MIVEVRIENDFYVGIYRGKAVTKQKSLEKCLVKLSKYVKGLN